MHYTVKSRQDFEVKVKRGSANAAKGKDWSFFQAMNQCVSPYSLKCPAAATIQAVFLSIFCTGNRCIMLFHDLQAGH